MKMSQKLNVNVKRTVEQSVGKNEEFHFHIDELTSSDTMPTYSGNADEKYNFEEMDDAFFEFLNRKIQGEGIYIRLVFASGNVIDGEAVFDLEYGDTCEKFKTDDLDNVLVFEFADFGIKVRGEEVTFGATVNGGCVNTHYFAEFGSSKANNEFLSLENPLNKRILEIMEEMIDDK